MKYNVIIGRFAPFHKGHEALFKAATEYPDNSELIVLVGSSFKYPDTTTPFTFEERVNMIEASRVTRGVTTTYIPIPDYTFGGNTGELLWMDHCRNVVNDYINQESDEETGETYSIHLYGHQKDGDDEFFNELCGFTDWNYVDVDADPKFKGINATKIRDKLFSKGNLVGVKSYLHKSTVCYLNNWIKTADRLVNEWKYLKAYKKSWSKSPYPPTFMAADCVLIDYTSGPNKTLLIKRGGSVGNGSWAIPGGFIDQHERTKTAAVRELKEETGIDLSILNIDECAYTGYHIADDPNRDCRGRVISFIHTFDIYKRAEVDVMTKAGDDAVECKWVDYKELKEMFENSLIFSDHYDILTRIAELEL